MAHPIICAPLNIIRSIKRGTFFFRNKLRQKLTLGTILQIRIFIVENKAIQNCINLKTTNLYISKNTFKNIYINNKILIKFRNNRTRDGQENVAH